MKEKELRELDAFCADNVMGWKSVSGTKLTIEKDEYFVHSTTGHVLHGNASEPFCPTTDPASAMEVLKKCAETVIGAVEVYRTSEGKWVIQDDYNDPNQQSETIELAIVKFAKQLFTK